ACDVPRSALDGGGRRGRAALGPVADDGALVLRGVEEVVHRLRWQVADRCPEVPAMGLADGLQDLLAPRGVHGVLRPRGERALGEALRRVGDQQVRVELEARPETRAGRARAVGRVEREVSRLELVAGEPVMWAAVALAVPPLL